MESKKEKEDDEDEGICKDSEKELESDTKKSNEKVIKQRIMNIIENAKTVDQKRPIRNYGRTFEFQNVQLKPTVPNDRRPAKAKRMDNLWSQTIAKKQGIQINLEPPAPKPKVPWTMKKNPQPQKKDEDKDVDEFEKCRDALKNSTGKPTPSLGKDIKTIQKLTATGTNKNKIESNPEGTKEELKIECINETSKEITKETIECKNTSVTCITNDTSDKTVLPKQSDAVETDDDSNSMEIANYIDPDLTKDKEK